MITKIVSFFCNITSGFATRREAKRRLAICESCPNVIREKGGMYCGGGCGCKKWWPSRLDRKSLFKADAICPRGKWGSRQAIKPPQKQKQQHPQHNNKQGITEEAMAKYLRPATDEEMEDLTRKHKMELIRRRQLKP